MRKVGFEVDGCAEEVEGAGGLLRAQVHQAQVVSHHPLKGAQVQGTLQAGNRSYVALQQGSQLNSQQAQTNRQHRGSR